jgi:RNA polymerase sigma-70 factor (ECF subfamily)
MLVYDREISLETPAYFVALDFDGDRVISIHDFLFARYAMDGVDLSLLDPALPKDTSEGDRVRTT